MTTNAANLFAGPAYVALGVDGTPVDLGLVNNVDVNVLMHRAGAVNEIGQLLKSGQWGAVVGANISITLSDKSSSILAAFASEFTTGSDVLKMSEVFASLSTTGVCVCPIGSYGSAATDSEVIWIPAVRFDDPGTWTYNLATGAGANETANPYTVSGVATLDSSLNAGYRMIWKGLPTASGFSESLPSGY